MKPWRFGIWTLGASLIAIGVLVILQDAGIVPLYQVLQYVWPVILIALGIEVLWYRVKWPGERLRASGWSIALIVIVCLASLADVGVNRAVNSLSAYGGSNWANLFTRFGPSQVVGIPVKGNIQTMPGVQEVQVGIPLGDVTVTPGSGKSVSFHGTIGVFANGESEARQVMQEHWMADVQGNAVVIRLDEPTHLHFPFGSGNDSYHLYVQVPASLNTNIHTTSGRIALDNMRASTIDESVNGTVTITHVDGDVTAKTVNGDCRVQGVTGNLTLNTVNGKLKFEQVRESVSANTVNGDIEGNSAVGGPWQLQTVNGDIQATLSGGGANLQASTVNGDIRGNLPWQYADNRHRSGQAIVGDGRMSVSMHTTSGDITVDRN